MAELDVEEVVSEAVAVFDGVLAGLVAGHDDVLGLLAAGAVLAEPATQHLAHRVEPTGLVGDLERDRRPEQLLQADDEQRDVV